MENLKTAYKAARKSGLIESRPVAATVALYRAKENLVRLDLATLARDKALDDMQAACQIDSRHYAPGMITAREALQKAEREWRNAWRAVHGRDKESTTFGAPFPINGDEDSRYATRGRWIENPDSAFRFVGLSSDIAPDRDRTTGYYVDTFQSETARGVVYQMRPTREGFARFIPAIADPSNSQPDGRGPAIMLLDDIITARTDCEDSAEVARRDAARRAMDAAETYADSSREYDTAWQAGVRAAELKAEAAESRREFLELRKEAKAARDDGITARPVLCDALRRQAESLVDAWQEAKAKAARLAEGDDESFYFYSGNKRLRAAFEEGLANG